jgi:hypothetical protein
VWLGGSEPAQIYLGQQTAGVWAPGEQSTAVHWVAVDGAKAAAARGLEVLAELCPLSKRHRVGLSLSGALARPFMFGAVQGLTRGTEALQVAAGLAPEATGLDGPCEVWLDRWVPGRPCLAIAVDRALREAIEAEAKERRVKLTVMRPWWVVAMNESAHEPATERRLLALTEPDALTVLVGGDEGFASAATYAPKPDAQQTEALLTRTMFAGNLNEGQCFRTELWMGLLDRSDKPLNRPTLPFGPRQKALP